MKKKWMMYLMSLLLIGSVTFVGCNKDDDEDDEPEITGKIGGLTATLATYNGRTIFLSFNNEAAEHITSLDAYDVYQSEDGGEFEKIKSNLSDTTYTDNRTTHGKTYRYFINFDGMYSDTIEIATAHPAMPWVSARARVTGEGSEAYIEHIKLEYFIGASSAKDVVDKFEFYRNNEKIGEYQISPVTNSNSFDYIDDDITFNFDEEYTYYIIAITTEGEQMQSLDAGVTANIPDAIDRPAPQVSGISTDQENNLIFVHVNDVSNSASYIELYADLDDGAWIWEGSAGVSELSTDENNNYKFALSTEDIPGGFKTLEYKARVTIMNKNSDWSNWGISTVFIHF